MSLSSTSMINGWIQVETAEEVAVYAFWGGSWYVGKLLDQHINIRLQNYLHGKR